MKTKTIRQKVTFKASAHDVYEALMDAKKHARFTGGPAKIGRKVGGTFSVYDDYVTEKNLELVLDKKIVQTWRASDWEEGHFSTVVFDLQSTKNRMHSHLRPQRCSYRPIFLNKAGVV